MHRTIMPEIIKAYMERQEQMLELQAKQMEVAGNQEGS